MPDPLALTLSWNNGSVPPKYRTSTTIVIQPDGSGTWIDKKGYSKGESTTRAFHLTTPEAQALATRLDDLGLWRTEWTEPDRPQVGGGTSPLTARWGERSVRVPSIVAAEQREAKRAIVTAIQEATRQAESASGARG